MLSGSRILLVEDNVDLAENVAEILSDEGATVITARSGAEGRQLGAQQPFDVALVDVRLPDESGLEVASVLRESGDGQSEVLVVTGHASLEDAIDALDRGVYAYLLKPFKPEELLADVGRAFRQVVSSRRARQLADKLAHQEANLRTLVNTVQALLLVLDEDGRVIHANPAVEAAAGTKSESIVGASWIESYVPEADREAVRQALRAAVAEGSYSLEHRILSRGSGGGLEERWIRWQMASLVSTPGETRIYASGLDLTEVRDLEQRARLSERLAAVGTLTAGLAHEVRNPLNAALLQLDLVERRAARHECPTGVLEPLVLVRQEITRLSSLLNDFLRFARPPRLELGKIDLAELVRDVVTMQTPAARAHNVTLRALVPKQPAMTLADGDKIRQVLVNLVQNAIEAIDNRGEVSVHVEPDGAGYRMRVRDSGPGIAPDIVDHIFEPFFTTKEGGTGLGMAICYSLIAHHGGDIRLHQHDGTEFEVILPPKPPGAVETRRSVFRKRV